MNRRNFVKNTAIGSVAATGLLGSMSAMASEASASSNAAQFKLKYAPSLGMFGAHSGNDVVDQINFIHDMGFRAVFDNGLMGRDAAMQEKIAAELAKRNMDLGPFVLYADFGKKSMVTRNPEIMEMLKDKMKEAIEVRKRTNVKYALVVPGRFDESLAWDYQTAN
ncbi:MAG: twin-arginine translocation signal domain-containing protein, partial [Prolixibacteraceae bacterium]|nr:twin-arginine translocation signal domain-containing protein [Prolixibacteraceae bacterium]